MNSLHTLQCKAGTWQDTSVSASTRAYPHMCAHIYIHTATLLQGGEEGYCESAHFLPPLICTSLLSTGMQEVYTAPGSPLHNTFLLSGSSLLLHLTLSCLTGHYGCGLQVHPAGAMASLLSMDSIAALCTSLDSLWLQGKRVYSPQTSPISRW